MDWRPPTLLPMATSVVRSGITLMREASLTFVVDPRVLQLLQCPNEARALLDIAVKFNLTR